MNDLFKPIGNLSAYSGREILEDIHRMLALLLEQKKPPKITGSPKARHEYEPEFEKIWKAYPARDGSNPKWKAQQSWRARQKEAYAKFNSPLDSRNELAGMLKGVKRYAVWCEATGKTGTEMVMQTARFLGPGKEYENAWEVAKPEPAILKLPRDNNELVKFAAKRGLSPRAGEDWWEFRKRIEDAL